MPYSEIDPDILPLVELLNANGFPTTSSCQGGEGHAFPRPTIRIDPQGDCEGTATRLSRFLLGRGAHGFSISRVHYHQKSEAPETYSYVELEIWSQDTLRYLTS